MKRISLTPKLEEALKASLGQDAKPDDYYVFETVAVSSRPINKKGSLFNKGVVVLQTLEEMAEIASQPGESIPLILSHAHFGDDALPHGRVFQGKVYPTEDGFHELRTFFALPNPETDRNSKRAALTRDVDTGILTDVSAGFSFKKIISVGTGYDFLTDNPSPNANPFLGLDDEGNTMGEDGHFVNCVGINEWKELSLVRTGASTGARVSDASRNRLAQEFSADSGVRKLAASGMTADQSVLFLSTDFGHKKTPKPEPTGDLGMDKELLAQLATTNKDLGTSQAKVTTLEASVTSLTTERDTANADVARLTTELEAANKAKDEAEAKLAAAEAEAPEGSVQEVTAVKTFVDAHFDAAVKASGKTGVKAGDLAAKLTFITEEGIALHKVVSAGTDGKSVDNGTDAKFDAATSAILKANRKGDK